MSIFSQNPVTAKKSPFASLKKKKVRLKKETKDLLDKELAGDFALPKHRTSPEISPEYNNSSETS
jgi:hypothetical protein